MNNAVKINGLRIGVATKDGVSINLHFGHANTFWVYEVADSQFRLVEKREVEKYCHGHADTAGVISKIMETIKDCKAVFSAKIGDKPAARLESIGIRAIDQFAYESIGDALLEYSNSISA